MIPSSHALIPQSPYNAMPSTARGNVNLSTKDPINFRDVPAMLWLPEYENNHEPFYRKIQHMSDHMMARGAGVYSHGNPNTRACRPAYEGKINMKDYLVADAFYGQSGSAKIKDYAFYHSVTQRHLGSSLQEPLKFTYRDISPTAISRRQRAIDQQISESMRRRLAEAYAKAAEEAGQPADFSFLTNPDVYLPEDGIYTAPTHSAEERAGHAMLVDAVKRHDIKDVFHQCREDAIVLNARMAHIVSDRRGVRPVRLDPDRTHWIAPGPITSDRDCDAIGTWDYPSVPEILNQDGLFFANANTIKGLTDTVDELKSGRSFLYNPREYHFSGETQVAFAGDRNYPMDLDVLWQEKFYPGSTVYDQLNSMDIGVLRHQLYFKMIHFLRCKVFVKGKPATEESYKEWRMRNYDNDIDIRFEPMDEGDKKKPGDYIHKIPIINLWQARRYGHNVLVDVHRCTHVPKVPTANTDPRFPIVIQVSFKRGFVALGLDFQRMWNVLWNRIEEQLNLGGAESALLIDEAQLKNKQDSKKMMWQAKKLAVLHYNSALLQDRSNTSAQKHLTRVQLTNESNTINNMLALAGLIKSIYDGMVGDPGNAGAYDSASKLSIVNSRQSAITTEFSYKDNQFQNDVFQRTAEVQKTVVNGDEWAEVLYDGAISGRVGSGKNARKTIFIPKTMKDVMPQVEVDNGLDLMTIRQKIESMAERILPSGGAGGIREFIRLLFEDDAYEALAIFDAGMSEVEKAEAANSAAAQQNAAQRNEVEAMKARVPIETMQMRTEADKIIAHVKEQRKAEEMNMKADTKDVDEVNTRERMVLQNELDSGRQDMQVNQQAQQQAMLQGQQTEQQAMLQQQQAMLDRENDTSDD
ncbi:MAG TPA: hypothetical protein VGB67_04075 [Fibrella sp.]|jgi:hypothetical protein